MYLLYSKLIQSIANNVSVDFNVVYFELNFKWLYSQVWVVMEFEFCYL